MLFLACYISPTWIKVFTSVKWSSVLQVPARYIRDDSVHLLPGHAGNGLDPQKKHSHLQPRPSSIVQYLPLRLRYLDSHARHQRPDNIVGRNVGDAVGTQRSPSLLHGIPHSKPKLAVIKAELIRERGWLRPFRLPWANRIVQRPGHLQRVS